MLDHKELPLIVDITVEGGVVQNVGVYTQSGECVEFVFVLQDWDDRRTTKPYCRRCGRILEQRSDGQFVAGRDDGVCMASSDIPQAKHSVANKKD